MTNPKPIVGIDLGTTFSLVAVLRNGVPTLLPNGLGETLTPSAVSFTEDGGVLVGAPARARATTHPERTVLEFKRDMGTRRTYEIAGRTMTPEQLSALILAQLKRDAEEALGVLIDEAVVSVPAYFGDAQRQATRDAGAIAGLKVERIINEPTAAALAFGIDRRDVETRAIVLDLGGGTFDVTVLEVIEGVIEIQSSAGDARLGGADFDDALAELFAKRIRALHEADIRQHPVSWARLRSASETLKKRLSTEDRATLALPGLALGRRTVDIELPLSRTEAEEAWASLLARVRAPIVRALSDASVTPKAIETVLLVGGSSRMPCVARLAAEIFGRLPRRDLPPDEAVALGAAVQAALKQDHRAVEDLVVTDVAPFSLGIATAQNFGDARVRGVFSPILERGTVIPASRSKTFSTIEHGQTQLKVEIYQGEHSLCSDNHLIGELVVRGLPPGSAGQLVDVRFTYDANGILEVDATVTKTGVTTGILIENSPGRLSAGEIASARKAMQKLKVHPKELLPNTTALARADALYVELSGPARAFLGQLIGAFRAALEHQQPETIDALRADLIRATLELRHGSHDNP